MKIADDQCQTDIGSDVLHGRDRGGPHLARSVVEQLFEWLTSAAEIGRPVAERPPPFPPNRSSDGREFPLSGHPAAWILAALEPLKFTAFAQETIGLLAHALLSEPQKVLADKPTPQGAQGVTSERRRVVSTCRAPRDSLNRAGRRSIPQRGEVTRRNRFGLRRTAQRSVPVRRLPARRGSLVNSERQPWRSKTCCRSPKSRTSSLSPAKLVRAGKAARLTALRTPHSPHRRSR